MLPAPIIAMGGGISLVLATLLDVAFFIVLYMMLSHGTSIWREILPGLLFGAYLSVSYFQLKQQQKETVVEIRQ